jgi:short-subunit dehydrogenase
MKVIVITGASDGIGAELARQWAARDRGELALVLAARNVERLQAVAAQCASHGARTLVQRCDVGVQAECDALVRATIDAYGRLDTLVNNAGMSAHARFADTPDLKWTEALMRINHWGSVWCTHAALPHLVRSGGRIVAVSSVAGLVGVPFRTAYCATKYAMTGFFEALRAELAGAGVSVTIANPRVVATQIRHHGYNAQGQPAGFSGLDERHAMSVERCARLIIDGAEARRREIVMTPKARLGRWLKLLLPGVVERMALAALAKSNAEAGAPAAGTAPAARDEPR